MKKTLYIGMPGSGKTTTLLNIVERYLQKGISPKKIAFVSFSKKAVFEAVFRATQLFNLQEKELPYFKTLHALAYQELSLQRGDIVKASHFKELAQMTGIRFNHKQHFSALHLYHLAQAKKITLYDVWQMTETIHKKDFKEVLYCVESYCRYKTQHLLHDFTDMIVQYNQFGRPIPVDIAIIDEAQDLTTIQFEMIEKAFGHCEQMFLAGDDDQAIYGWSGADRNKFLNIEAHKIILDKSYRIPKIISNVANTISNRISKRYQKTLISTEKEGRLFTHKLLGELQRALQREKWLILVRNVSQINKIKNFCMDSEVGFNTKTKKCIPHKLFCALKAWQKMQNHRVVFGWELLPYCQLFGLDNKKIDTQISYQPLNYPVDIVECDLRSVFPKNEHREATYFQRMLPKIDELANPRITISTIHSAKGGEADHVVLFLDQSRLVERAFNKHPDNEHRVFYVGATRSKQTLYIMQPKSRFSYKIT